MDKEIMDIVDLDDRVVGQTSREEIYTQKLPHRIVHVMIHDGDGNFLLQLRSATARYLPLYYVTSAGGHVDTGESYLNAASREMREETGVDIPLLEKGKYLYYSDDDFQKWTTVFEGELHEEYIPNPNEVAELRWMSRNEISRLIASGDHIHPELAYVWDRFYSSKTPNIC